jgi:hypothetical protein
MNFQLTREFTFYYNLLYVAGMPSFLHSNCNGYVLPPKFLIQWRLIMKSLIRGYPPYRDVGVYVSAEEGVDVERGCTFVFRHTPVSINATCTHGRSSPHSYHSIGLWHSEATHIRFWEGVNCHFCGEEENLQPNTDIASPACIYLHRVVAQGGVSWECSRIPRFRET